MLYGRVVAIAAGLVTALLGMSGCLSTDGWDSGPASTPATSSVSSTSLQDRDDFVAALKKTIGHYFPEVALCHYFGEVVAKTSRETTTSPK